MGKLSKLCVVRHAMPLDRLEDAIVNQEIGMLLQLHYQARWVDVPKIL